MSDLKANLYLWTLWHTVHVFTSYLGRRFIIFAGNNSNHEFSLHSRVLMFQIWWCKFYCWYKSVWIKMCKKYVFPFLIFLTFVKEWAVGEPSKPLAIAGILLRIRCLELKGISSRFTYRVHVKVRFSKAKNARDRKENFRLRRFAIHTVTYARETCYLF